MADEPLNYLLLTFDSCRYDALCDAETPVIDSYAEIVPALSPANYTYAAHQAFFVGHLPNASLPSPYYNRFIRQLIALANEPGGRVHGAHLNIYSEINLITGLRDAGYHTVGAGAMDWFRQQALIMWFEHFRYTGTDADAQISYLLEEIDKDSRPFFGFINFGETHDPFTYAGKENRCPFRVQARCMEWPPVERGRVGRQNEAYWHQVEAASFLDTRLPRLFSNLPANTVIIICGDHGEAFGEDGYWGHGVTHPTVFEVPLAIFRLDGGEIA